MKLNRLFIIYFFLWSLPLFGQEQFPNTLFYNEAIGSPTASLTDISWIEGHWRGEAFGGIAEEIWGPPLGNSMMCVFKLVVDGDIIFYEIETISEENNSLILRLKHFNKHLKGWEEKNETIDFKLVKVDADKVYFDGFTFEKISKDEINMYVVIEDMGKKAETKFNYHRVMK